MKTKAGQTWKDQVTTPDKVLAKIKPGMRIFIGNGVSEPLTQSKNIILNAI